MGLEAATHIADLVNTNPVGASDFVSQGDDHIRLIKSVLKTDFAAITGAVTSSHTELNLLDGATGLTGTGSTVRSASPTFTGTMVADVITAGAGSAATPSLSFAGDPNTGLYSAAADTLGFAAGGTVRATLTGSVLQSAVQSTELSHATPILRWNESDQGADLKNWIAVATGGFWRLGFSTDAAPTSNVATAIQITRNTTTITETELNGTVLDFNGRVDADGDIHDINGTTSVTLTGTANAVIALTTSGISATGALTTPNTSASELGYKGTPQNGQDGNYTLVLADAGKVIYKNAGGAGETITIPANASVAFPVGTIIRIINNGGGTLSIAITTDTLTLAGTSTTGTRTLADNSIAVIEKVTTTEWFISGVGLS